VKKITKTTWLDILASPFVLALPITIVIILFLPDIFQKYVVTQTSSGRCDKPNSVEEYYDLDNDGYSERVVAFPNELGLPSVKVLHNDGTLIDQWNFSGKYPKLLTRFICTDLNNDSIQEIYVFTVSHDTLYLSAFAPMEDGRFFFKNKFVTTIDYYEDNVDLNIRYPTNIDIDADGLNELLFVVHSGFSKQPRGLFVYNARLDTIIRTPVLGASINNVLCTDLNDDQKPEFFCSSNTVGNIPDSLGIPYNDYSSWFMGFDENLRFLFPPVEFKAYPSKTGITEIYSGNKKRIVTFFNNKSKSNLSSMIVMFDREGKVIRKRMLGMEGLPLGLHPKKFSMNYKNTPVIVSQADDHTIILLDTMLNPVKRIKESIPLNIRFKFDLDRDGTQELIFRSDDYPVMVMQSPLDDRVNIKVERKAFPKIPFCVSVKQNGDDLPELFIKAENDAYLYTYHFNKLYYMKYPIWLGIYLVILSIILLIRYLQKIQLQHKMEVETRLNALQLKTIKSQMDPHFIFNALNSISTSILTGQNKTAHHFLIKFSKLLRSMFDKAGELTIPLEEQLNFVQNYLELEMLRFKEKISYEIEVSPDVDTSVQMPRMIIQLFVENALKHGLRHKEGKGNIFIKVTQADSKIRIIIEDDGIGRRAASQHKDDSHGKGLTIIHEMTGLFEKVKGVRIIYRYEDLFDETGQPAGTRVVVEVPVGEEVEN